MCLVRDGLSVWVGRVMVLVRLPKRAKLWDALFHVFVFGGNSPTTTRPFFIQLFHFSSITHIKKKAMASPTPLKRERDESNTPGAAVSSDDDFITASSSPASKKAKSPSVEPSSLHASPTSAATAQTEQLEAIFRNMRLRRIVKENHTSEINQLAFCLNTRHNHTPFGLDQVKTFEKRGAVKRDPDDNSNILGTTGGPQVNTTKGQLGSGRI